MAMADWSPTEIALVVAAAGGLITAISTSAANFVALWRLNTKVDGMLVDRDASNVTKGERKVHAEQAAAKDVASVDAVRDASTAAQVKAVENGTPQDTSPLSKKV